MGVSTSPAQRCRRRSTASRRVDDVAGELRRSKEAGVSSSCLVHERTTAQRLKALQSHSLRAILALILYKLVLKAKDMILMLLYDLEIFLGVCGMFSNSSNLQNGRGEAYI